MLKNIIELERRYEVTIEEDGDFIFLYSYEFEDEDTVKSHVAIIDMKNDTVGINYNHHHIIFENDDHVLDDHGDVCFANDFASFISNNIWVLCNHWSLFNPREQMYLEIFENRVTTFIKEVLYIEEV